MIQFAPDNFKQHLEFLSRKKVFNEVRADLFLKNQVCLHHYLFTGKRGVGKEAAAKALFNQLKELNEIKTFITCDAVTLLDTTSGYSPNIENFVNENRNRFIYLYNAEALIMKGAIGSLTGIEILANKLRTIKDIVVVLAGKKGQLTELINICESARELFYTRYDFEDIKPDDLLSIACEMLQENGYLLSDAACDKLLGFLAYNYNLRGTNFENSYFVKRIIQDQIIPKHIVRVTEQGKPDIALINQIEAADIPDIEVRDPAKALKNLESLIGLTEIKKSVINHTALVALNKLRAEKGFYNKMPAMHMVFTGNPGTGKTTIAKYIGEIYHGIGALSSGHLVETDRSKLIGQYLGETEKNTLNAIERAGGGVLFIDEAYNLFVESQDRRDYGMRVIETLLTYLSLEDMDMIVILAGYTNEMNKLLESNPGLKSRFSYLFKFDDYTPDQLLKIGEELLVKENYYLAGEARETLSRYIIEEYNNKDEHFGNGRFITRLIKSHIIPNMSQRLIKIPARDLTDDLLKRIESRDIPNHQKNRLEASPIDETILSESFKELDALIAQDNAKKALHDLAMIMRLKYNQGTLNLNIGDLFWTFIGHTGTGKSSIAEILGRILQGFGILKRGHTISINADEFIENMNYPVLENALKRADNGLFFLDLDAPKYKGLCFDTLRLWIENRIYELKLRVAVVIAEMGNDSDAIAKNLATNGICSYNNIIVFDDFNDDELGQIFKFILKNDYHLELTTDAQECIFSYITSLKANTRPSCDISARIMQQLAHSVAQTAQLRMATQYIEKPEEQKETAQQAVLKIDVDAFTWDGRKSGKMRIGYY